MLYVDARTTIFFFEFFLAVPFLAGRDTAEKFPTEQMFLCETVIMQETYL